MFNVKSDLEPGGRSVAQSGGGRGGPQTTLLTNDHHPLLIEFEQDHHHHQPRELSSSNSSISSSARFTRVQSHPVLLPDNYAGVDTGAGSSNMSARICENGGGNLPPGRVCSSSRLLETHFDEPSSSSYGGLQHARSTSASAVYQGGGGGVLSSADAMRSNSTSAMYGGGGGEGSAAVVNEAPYISSSVTLPAAREELGFYQNVSGRFRSSGGGQSAGGGVTSATSAAGGGGGYRTRDEQRSSFSRQAELHKSPKTQELEEFAAKFEGYQKQRSRRNLQPTPMLDQLARENQAAYWINSTVVASGGSSAADTSPPVHHPSPHHHQLSPLETNLLKLVQRTDSISRRTDTDTYSSGRESVTTVISNSSGETLKYTDRRHSSSEETLRYIEDGVSGDDYVGGSPINHHQAVNNPLLTTPTSDMSASSSPYRHCDLYSESSQHHQQQQQQLADTYGNYMNMSQYNNISSNNSSNNSLVYPGRIWSDQATGTVRRVLCRSLSESASKHEIKDAAVSSPPGTGGRESVQSDYAEPTEIVAGNDSQLRGGGGHDMSAQDAWRQSHRLPAVNGADNAAVSGGHRRAEVVGEDVEVKEGQVGQISTQYVEGKNTFPRGSTRRKPKLPTPPSSPPLGRSTPSPPPPPLPEADLITSTEPLPPPPSLAAAAGHPKPGRQLPINHHYAAAGKQRQLSQQQQQQQQLCNQSSTSSHYKRQESPAVSQQQQQQQQRSTAAGGYHKGNNNHHPPKQLHLPAFLTGETDRQTPPLLNGRKPAPTPSSPTGRSPASTPTQMQQNSGGGRQPASTPKRESPATIAAKEAPGWQMFLGVKSSTVNFTSEEVNKFRAARDHSKTRSLKRDEKLPTAATNATAGTNRFVADQEMDHSQIRAMWREEERRAAAAVVGAGKDGVPVRREERTAAGWKDHHDATGSRDDGSSGKLKRTGSRGRKRSENPNRSLDLENINPNQKRQSVEDHRRRAAADTSNSFRNNKLSSSSSSAAANGKRDDHEDTKQHSLHLSRERSLKSISSWWKNSLEAGPSPPSAAAADWGSGGPGPENSAAPVGGANTSPKHNHSHSDSGISSLSGRSSCMSPMSDLSSSSGSSRTSLRSSSIVSASNIPLEEEDNEEVADYEDLCRDMLVYSPQDSRLYSAIKCSLIPSLSVYFPEGSLEFEIVTNSRESPDTENLRRNHSSNFDESRKKLLMFASQRIETQRKHQQLLRESLKTNEEFGKEVITELRQIAQKQEVDKVKLFIEEIDKITSLIIGLSSRLVRTNVNPPSRDDPDLAKQFLEKKSKLEEQLEEARKLRQSIFRRSAVVFLVLSKYLPQLSVDSFGGFIKEKIRLILDTRQHTDTLKNEEEILKLLKEYSTGVMII